ncbi:hypothetical protein [uncultured Tenacibaculum sp.]|uniref:hypothetical protein n=1 Tax=uncultured Tenacibaculum sp. TaxID=174713 RepID=UPI002638C6EA|nr:hypothetical protein [uncultured Tenacibaculum sp.]
MAEFARLFELPNNNQVLLTLEYDNEDNSFEIKVRSEINGATASLSFGFDTEEKALKMLEEFNLLNAKNARNEMMNVLM